MKWFRHSTNASFGRRLQGLEQKYGLAGLGLFWKVYECVLQSDVGFPLGYAQSWCSKSMSRDKIRKIIIDSGYFEIDDMGVIRLRPTSGSGGDSDQRTEPIVCSGASSAKYSVQSVCSGTSSVKKSEQTPPSSRTRGEEKRLDKTKEKKNDVVAKENDDADDGISEKEEAETVGPDAEPEATATSADHPMQLSIEAMTQLLTQGPEHQRWRETLSMQLHASLRKIVETELPWAIDFFLRYAVATGKDLVLYKLPEAKSYFFYFCTNPKTRVRLLEAYRQRGRPAVVRLAEGPDSPYRFEEVDADGRRSYDGQPIPADAPPRPSDSAQWDYGGGRWY